MSFGLFVPLFLPPAGFPYGHPLLVFDSAQPNFYHSRGLVFISAEIDNSSAMVADFARTMLSVFLPVCTDLLPLPVGARASIV
jgi:hypothetical protein